MFHIKICGITRIEDAQMAAAAGADAIGLNFYTGSKRCVTQPQARELIQQAPSGLLPVGLFVNAEAREVCRLFDELPLGLIQLHGDEPPEYLAELGDRPVMRAFRMDPDGWLPLMQYLDRCRTLGCLPQMVLVDAFQTGEYGGTGQLADWNLLADWQSHLADLPLVLAGGLTPENVADAIQTVRPVAVDTASGVEASPGVKDPEKTKAFARIARAALGIESPCQS